MVQTGWIHEGVLGLLGVALRDLRSHETAVEVPLEESCHFLMHRESYRKARVGNRAFQGILTDMSLYAVHASLSVTIQECAAMSGWKILPSAEHCCSMEMVVLNPCNHAVAGKQCCSFSPTAEAWQRAL